MNSLLHHTIQRAATRFPDKDAFRFMGRSLTYRELAHQSNQLAGLLVELGVRKGDRVGIYLDRSLEAAIAVYGIMTSGAAFVPLDTQAPSARTRELLEDCDIRHIVSRPSLVNAIKEVLKHDTGIETVIGVSGELSVKTIRWEEVQRMHGVASAQVHVEDHDLAYIMYTSGSTGIPKGIMHTHHSGLSYARLSCELYGIRPDDRIGSHSPLHFDMSTLGFFTGPFAAATTVIIPEAHTKMPASLSKHIEDERLTIWYSVPLALTQMLQRGVLEERDLKSLRWVLFGGEQFPAKHLRTLMALLPNARFSNVYGPAEVNQCTFFNPELPPGDDENIPLGKAWNDTEILIIDDQDREVRSGVIGELIVRTETMMKGYWRQPELTRNSLYTRELTEGCREVFYRTGDLARFSADGNLLFLGRKDRQIKTRGYRVELDEVESVIMRHEIVNEAAVYPVKNGSDSIRIEATIIVVEGAEGYKENLRRHLEEFLPWYAIPVKITSASSLARTSAGKINYKELELQATNPLNS